MGNMLKFTIESENRKVPCSDILQFLTENCDIVISWIKLRYGKLTYSTYSTRNKSFFNEKYLNIHDK